MFKYIIIHPSVWAYCRRTILQMIR